MTRALSPLSAPTDPPARRSAEPLPPYRHVPGLTPHPVTHPEGHSHGEKEVPLAPIDNLNGCWRGTESYLYGVDLFNRAFLWEAHEAWEAVWHAVPKASSDHRFLQGLIQIAAGLLQRHRGVKTGYRRLYDRGSSKLREVEHVHNPYAGVLLTEWLQQVEKYLAEDPTKYPFLLLVEGG